MNTINQLNQLLIPNSLKMLKSLLNIIILVASLNQLNAQSQPVYYTDYTKVEGGKIQDVEHRFELKNGIMYVIDLSNNKTTEFGPLKKLESKFSGGLYFEGYISAIEENPQVNWASKPLELFTYCYTKEGGELLYIEKLEITESANTSKKFYTKSGYNKFTEPIRSNYIAHQIEKSNEETEIKYTGGKITVYRIDPVTEETLREEPWGKIDFINYNTFYKKYTIFYRYKNHPEDKITWMTYEYVKKTEEGFDLYVEDKYGDFLIQNEFDELRQIKLVSTELTVTEREGPHIVMFLITGLTDKEVISK